VVRGSPKPRSRCRGRRLASVGELRTPGGSEEEVEVEGVSKARKSRGGGVRAEETGHGATGGLKEA